MVRVGINGFGRIGRSYLRAVFENKSPIEIIAVNDLASTESLIHLLRYDTAFGRFKVDYSEINNSLIVNGKEIKVIHEKDPSQIPWKNLGVDIVIESTGVFTHAEQARLHLKAGAKKVLISAPGTNVDATIVFGINDDIYDVKTHHVVSNASCTTNCLAPLVKILDDAFQIEYGQMVTIHASTQDQNVQDGPHRDLRRARSALANIIPTSTGAATAIGMVLPGLHGKLDGYAMRVPVLTGSIVDLSIYVNKKVSIEEINSIFEFAALNKFKNILKYTTDPIVSSDVIGEPFSCIFDSSLTKVIGEKLVNIVGWYDNEWGFSNRLIDTTLLLGKI